MIPAYSEESEGKRSHCRHPHIKLIGSETEEEVREARCFETSTFGGEAMFHEIGIRWLRHGYVGGLGVEPNDNPGGIPSRDIEKGLSSLRVYCRRRLSYLTSLEYLHQYLTSPG